MFLKYPATILSFFIISALQASYLPFSRSPMGSLNLVFITFILLVFFKGINNDNYGFFLVITAGFFTDIFSNFYFGSAILAFLALFFSIKYFFYFLKEARVNYSIAYFSIVFSASFILYGIFLKVISTGPALSYGFLANFLYNLSVACLGFYIFLFFGKIIKQNRQLKLV